MRRIPAVVAISLVSVATLVAGSCGSGPLPLGGSDGTVERTDGLSAGGWMAARTTDDGLRIVLVGAAPLQPGNPCTADYEASAVERDTEVRITVITRSPTPPEEYDCNAKGYTRLVDVALDGPLDGRQVVFEPYGRPEEVFDASGLLEPETLPDGWSRQTESAYVSDPELGPAWYVTWAAPRPEPTDGACTPTTAPVTLTQGATDLPGFFEAHSTAVGELVVRGRPATVLTSKLVGDRTLVWTDGDHGYALSSSEACAGDEVSTTDQLVAFAESLR